MKRGYKHRVEHWDLDEPDNIIVTLHYGWSFEPYHEGVRGFDTAKEAWKAVREAHSCKCAECAEETSGN